MIGAILLQLNRNQCISAENQMWISKKMYRLASMAMAT